MTSPGPWPRGRTPPAAAFGGAWIGWRSVAEQHVRDGNLDEAIAAYREADRRAPAEERGAIANRIAWLLKETGHDFASRRQFNRARGRYGSYAPLVTWAIIATCVLVFVADWILAGTGSVGIFGNGGPLVERLLIARPGPGQGEWWRIFTSAFVHLGIAHIAFNMSPSTCSGRSSRRCTGTWSTSSSTCSAPPVAASSPSSPRPTRPRPARRGRSSASSASPSRAAAAPRRDHAAGARDPRPGGTLLAINLVFTFAIPGISWTGHVGGLLVGLLIGFFLPPRQVATIRTMFRRPDGTSLDTERRAGRRCEPGSMSGSRHCSALATYYALALA